MTSVLVVGCSLWLAPTLLNALLSPWLLSDGQTLHFKIASIQPTSISIEQVRFESAEASANLAQIKCSWQWSKQSPWIKLQPPDIHDLSLTIKSTDAEVMAKSESTPLGRHALSPEESISLTPQLLQRKGKLFAKSLKEVWPYLEQLPPETPTEIRVHRFTLYGLGEPLAFPHVTISQTQNGVDLDVLFQHLGLCLDVDVDIHQHEVNVETKASLDSLPPLELLTSSTFKLETLTFQSNVTTQWDQKKVASITSYSDDNGIYSHWNIPTNASNLQQHIHWAPQGEFIKGSWINSTGAFPWEIDVKETTWLTEHSHVSGKPWSASQLNISIQPSGLSLAIDDFNQASLSIPKLRALFPFSSSQEGHLFAELIMDDQNVLLQGTPRLEKQRYSIMGNLQAERYPLQPLPFVIQADAQTYALSANLMMEEQWLDTRLEELSTDAPPGMLQLKVDGGAQVKLDLKHGLTKQAWLNWSEGTLATDDFNTMITGLRGGIEAHALDQTLPHQILAWDQFSHQSFQFGEGELKWMLEPEETLFMESLTLNWCGGVMTLLPMTLNFPIDELSLSMFCEGIELDDLLQQFQVGQVQGKGKLGGRITMHMDPQDIRFENAYLYTAPNTEGELKVIEAKGLDQAMNQNQMLLVREALKDYRYEWASLQFDTSNGDFLLKLNMDGKPADLLPFRFDTQTASFVYDPESPGTHLQGLKLKTNFQCHGLWGIMMKGMKWMENVELK